MKQLIFTVYDVKAEVFLPPFVVPTLGLATRAFKDCVNSDEHQFGQHPSDYTLFQLAEFDDGDAFITINDKRSLGNGVEFLDSTPPTGNAHDSSDTPVQPNEKG